MKKGTIAVLSSIAGAAAGATAVAKTTSKENKKWKELADKHMALMLLYNQWMITKQEGKSVSDYLIKNDIHSVAIYGMSYVGERLYDELKDSEVDVKYAIDKNANSIYAELEIVQPDDELDKVDAIIVTPVFYFDEINELLEKKIETKILSFEDVLYEL